MIKYALPVAVLYFAVASTAVALPGSTLPQLTSPNDIVQGEQGQRQEQEPQGRVTRIRNTVITTTATTTTTAGTTITASTTAIATPTGLAALSAASPLGRSGTAHKLRKQTERAPDWGPFLVYAVSLLLASMRRPTRAWPRS